METPPQSDDAPQEDPGQAGENQKRLVGLLLLLMRNTRQSLVAFCVGFTAGHINLLELHDALVQTLTESHAEASALGRQFAGKSAGDGASDAAMSAAVMEQQAPFLEGLLADMKAGRYVVDKNGQLLSAANPDSSLVLADDAPTLTGALLSRLTLYALAMRATAQASWLFAQDGGQVIAWTVNAGENCEGCIAMGEGSPYAAGDLQQVPGDGQTPCLANCNCTLSIEDGREGVPHITLD